MQERTLAVECIGCGEVIVLDKPDYGERIGGRCDSCLIAYVGEKERIDGKSVIVIRSYD